MASPSIFFLLLFHPLLPSFLSPLIGKMSKQKDLQEGGVYVYFYFKVPFIMAGRLGQWEQQALQL